VIACKGWVIIDYRPSQRATVGRLFISTQYSSGALVFFTLRYQDHDALKFTFRIILKLFELRKMNLARYSARILSRATTHTPARIVCVKIPCCRLSTSRRDELVGVQVAETRVDRVHGGKSLLNLPACCGDVMGY
jgi:hypothetical protein